jgi:hypothetical protein
MKLWEIKNNGVVQPVSKQRIGKHSSTTIELLLEMVFSTRTVQNGYKEDNWGNPVRQILCGGGVQYLHRSPASSMRRRKGNTVTWVWLGYPDPGGYKHGNLALQVERSLESVTVNCDRESRRTRTWEWQSWRGPAAIVNDSPIHSSERMLHKEYNRKYSVGK